MIVIELICYKFNEKPVKKVFEDITEERLTEIFSLYDHIDINFKKIKG